MQLLIIFINTEKQYKLLILVIGILVPQYYIVIKFLNQDKS